MGWMKSMANGMAFACVWFVACCSGLCRGSEEGDICWFVGMVGMVGIVSQIVAQTQVRKDMGPISPVQ